MQTKTEMQQGWEFATGIMGAEIAARMGQEYVSAVEKAIKQLEGNINNHQYRNLGIGQLQGYMLEEWGAGTFNVDAAAANSVNRASVLHSTLKDSADIQLDSGEAYSAKSYVTAEKTAKAQARFSPESGHASYHGQGRLVPSDQISDAKVTAHREALRNQSIRPDVSDAYAETESKLTDTIRNDEGVSSKNASRKELEDIARESKDQKFKAEEHGVTAESAINTEYMLKQALKAGYTTAVITVALQLAPEIYKAIDFLIKHGEIDIQLIKRMGTKGISAGAEGFLRGSISSSLLIMCEKGALGEAFKGINPTILGMVVALVIHTVKNSILVAAGKMSPKQMGASFVDTVVISGGYLLGAHIYMSEIFSVTSFTVNQLIEKIDTGELGLPELQRPFIWSDTQVRDLFDSMMHGYPIGYLMLWECPELNKKKTIGAEAHSYDSPKEVIIDGQQRLTSLYAVMKGKKVINKKFDEKTIVISYCPLKNKFEVGYSATKKDPEWIYNISELYTSNNTFKYIGEFIQNLQDYRIKKVTRFRKMNRESYLKE